MDTPSRSPKILKILHYEKRFSLQTRVNLTAVAIGSSSLLACCIPFIVMSSEVVDFHNCICIQTSRYLYLYMHRLRAAAALPWPAAPPPSQFSGTVDLFATV